MSKQDKDLPPHEVDEASKTRNDSISYWHAKAQEVVPTSFLNQDLSRIKAQNPLKHGTNSNHVTCQEKGYSANEDTQVCK